MFVLGMFAQCFTYVCIIEKYFIQHRLSLLIEARGGGEDVDENPCVLTKCRSACAMPPGQLLGEVGIYLFWGGAMSCPFQDESSALKLCRSFSP